MPNHCDEYDQLTRRGFLNNGLQSAAAALLGATPLVLPDHLPRIALADPHVGPRGDTLVHIFLRGGADGLNMIVPHGDPDYYRLRPELAVAQPDASGADARTLDLDGFFGLHPMLQPLQAIYDVGDLAIVHATGATHGSRSHFVAQALLEQGLGDDHTGWLARHLLTLDTNNPSALRAVGIGDMRPLSLFGDIEPTVMQSIDRFQLRGTDEQQTALTQFLDGLYAQRDDILGAAAMQTLATIELLQQVSAPERNTTRAYPRNALGNALQTVAHLIEADVGVEVACVDAGGWDTHANQGGGTGQMANLLGGLGTALAAFYEQLGPRMANTTVVVQSEFGRRVAENRSGGTDHGYGNVLFALGGGINGGQVFADWPTLSSGRLVGSGDLDITTDYRDVLGEIVTARLNNPNVATVFPGHSVSPLGIAKTNRS